MADYTKLFDLAAPAPVKAAKNQGATTGGNYTKILDFGSDLLEKGTSVAMAVGESVGEGLDYIQDKGEQYFEKAKTGVQVASSTPVKTMLQDVFVPKFLLGDIDNSNFSPESIDILKKAAIDKGIKPGETIKLEYEDYNKYGAEISARFVSGKNEDYSTIKDKLINLKPADEVKMTLGDVLVKADENGNLTAIDQYDFNNWVYYGKGKQKNGKYLDLDSDEFEKSGITFLEALKDTLNNSPTDYQMIRNLAFLFGSRDYEGTERDTGRKVTLNLGTLNEQIAMAGN